MNFNLKFYLALLLRRLPIMTALALTCIVISVFSAMKLPPTFNATARLLVEEQQIPNSMVASTVQTDEAKQLQVIEQQLMTRANMIDIARKFNVFENRAEMTPDQVVQAMRRQTQIRRTGGRGQATLMSLAFEARSGQIAADVVNEYTTLILEKSSEFRISRAENALTFFQKEVTRLDGDLALQSAEIINFKNQNASALPGDLSFRHNQQANLQERLGRLEREKASALNQRQEVISVFETTGGIRAGRNPRQRTPQEEQLTGLQLQLDESLSVYSETNPRVVLLRNRIRQLEQTIKNATAMPREETELQTAEDESSTLYKITLAEIDQRIAEYDREINVLSKALEQLNASIAATSANAITLDSLEREYENIQGQYNEAINNLNQARMSERIEVSSQGQRISVIEGASIPQMPSGPNRTKIIAMGIGTGSGLAVAFFVLLEILNRTIRRPTELTSRFSIIPIAIIPYMETARERFWRRTLLVSTFVLALIGVPTGLYYVDTNYLPLDLLVNKILSRLGFA